MFLKKIRALWSKKNIRSIHLRYKVWLSLVPYIRPTLLLFLLLLQWAFLKFFFTSFVYFFDICHINLFVTLANSTVKMCMDIPIMLYNFLLLVTKNFCRIRTNFHRWISRNYKILEKLFDLWNMLLCMKTTMKRSQ